MPLRLLRSAVLGPMEHILWEVVAAPAASRTVDIDTVADALVTLLWSALQAPSSELAALRQLRDDVASALQRSNGA